MQKRKRLYIGVLVLIIIALTAVILFPRNNCVITVSASFHSEGNHVTTIHPDQEAEWAEKEHSAKKTPIRIINGELKRTIGYGPIELSGVFSKEEIKAFWPDAPLEEDWKFSAGLFNCDVEGNGHYQIYIDVQVDTKTGDAQANLYIYRDRLAHPTIAYWQGKVGEDILLRTDF